MFKISIFVLLVSLTFSTARILVPSITAENSEIKNFSLESFDGRYKLVIDHGNGFRVENVEEIAPGELLVKGQQDQQFDNDVYLFITYEAGRNGYIAKYNIGTTIGISKPQFLPANLLKSTAG